MTGAHDDRNPFDVLQTPPPGYVVTEEDRERWALAGQIAVVLWEVCSSRACRLTTPGSGICSGRSTTPNIRRGRPRTSGSSRAVSDGRGAFRASPRSDVQQRQPPEVQPDAQQTTATASRARTRSACDID